MGAQHRIKNDSARGSVEFGFSAFNLRLSDPVGQVDPT